MAKTFPKGGMFLDLVADIEVETAQITKARIPKLGVKAPRCLDAIGTGLALLDSAASCFWGCQQNDHRREYIIGRAVSSAYAAFRLLNNGYYDEALSLIRTIGEVANLTALFVCDADSYDRWISMGDQQRKQRFGPVKVRLALEAAGFSPPISEERYGALSEFSIHTHPASMPQAHSASGRPSTIPVYQEAAVLLALNELAISIGFLCVNTSRFVKLDEEKQEWLINAAHELGDSIGAVLVTEHGRPWFKLS